MLGLGGRTIDWRYSCDNGEDRNFFFQYVFIVVIDTQPNVQLPWLRD